MPADVDEQVRVLAAGEVHVISEDELRERIARGRPLRVKLGLDPTAADLHLGHAVVLRKLRQFQDFGHLAVLILGDFTAMVGDPSGRNATRPGLTREEVEQHARTYVEQLERILDPERLEVRRNSEWLGEMDMEDVLRLAARSTVARMLERDDFRRRHESGAPISISEFLYPLLQGWDSVIVEADVELGGTDQLFNLLVGRQLQEQEGTPPQVVLTGPLLEGLDGVQKMSKSLGNTVGVTDAPEQQFGKLMSIPDDLVPAYLQHTTGWPPERVEAVVATLGDGPAARAGAKRLLGRTIVDLYHGSGAGAAAEGEFDRVFKAHEAPAEMPEVEIGAEHLEGGAVRLSQLLVLSGLAPSRREALRKIEQGGVRLDGEVVTDDTELAAGALDGRALALGRRSWVRLRAPA